MSCAEYINRLCINVPYNEGEGNEHHILKRIKESSFPKYANVEFFYEDRHGNTYGKKPKGVFINIIAYIVRKDGMPKVSNYFKFPLKAPKIENIFVDLTEGNPKLAWDTIDIQSQRLKAQKDGIQSLTAQCNELKDQGVKLIKELAKLKAELSTVRNSKKWIYVNKLATIKGKVVKATAPRNGK